MRIFLTGATGFIGSFVAQQLVEKKMDVTCLVRESSNLQWLQELPVNFHVGSLMDPSRVWREPSPKDWAIPPLKN